jgi:hypothetical protein
MHHAPLRHDQQSFQVRCQQSKGHFHVREAKYALTSPSQPFWQDRNMTSFGSLARNVIGAIQWLMAISRHITSLS